MRMVKKDKKRQGEDIRHSTIHKHACIGHVWNASGNSQGRRHKEGGRADQQAATTTTTTTSSTKQHFLERKSYCTSRMNQITEDETRNKMNNKKSYPKCDRFCSAAYCFQQTDQHCHQLGEELPLFDVAKPYNENIQVIRRRHAATETVKKTKDHERNLTASRILA